MKILQVCAIQIDCNRNIAAQRTELTDQIVIAADSGAELIVLPELHNGHYFCHYQQADYFNLAEPLDGPTQQQLSQLAREYNIVIVGSIFERRTAGLYHNTALVLDSDGSLAGYYRKMHIPDDPGYNEKYYFTPGDCGFQPIPTRLGKLGVLICWDQWFPEAARLMALAGADILIYPTAIGWNPDDDASEQQRQLASWQIAQRAHAIANGLPLISCNRIGFEPDPTEQTVGNEFWGNSFICGAQGEILAAADTEAQQLITTLDLTRTETVRRSWPFLRDRRIDAYQDLIKRFID